MDKRDKRRTTDTKIIKKRIKLLKNLPGQQKYLETIVKEPGRLRDKHPLDCGKAKCQLCHSSKLFGNRGKKKAASKIKEQEEQRLPGDFIEEDFH